MRASFVVPEAVSLQVISERYANSEGHFLMNIQQISLDAFSEPTSCVVGDSEFFAPKADGPARNAELLSDVFLENALIFETSKKLTVWTAIGPTVDSVLPAPTVDRASANAKECGDC